MPPLRLPWISVYLLQFFSRLRGALGMQEPREVFNHRGSPAPILSASASALWQRNVNGTHLSVTERTDSVAVLSTISLIYADFLILLPFNPSYCINNNGTVLSVTEHIELGANWSNIPAQPLEFAQVLMYLPFYPSYCIDNNGTHLSAAEQTDLETHVSKF